MSHASLHRYGCNIGSLRPWEMFSSRRHVFSRNSQAGKYVTREYSTNHSFHCNTLHGRKDTAPWIRMSPFLSSGYGRLAGGNVFGAGGQFFSRSLVTARGKMDPYSVLGVSQASDAKQVKLGYLQKVLHHDQERYHVFRVQKFSRNTWTRCMHAPCKHNVCMMIKNGMFMKTAYSDHMTRQRFGILT